MLLKTSLVFRSGSNSLMFANYSVFGDAREVRSFVLCQKEMFGYDWISALKISKHFGHFFIKKFHEQFKFWWCSWGLKFSFGPKWDVRMCLKFDHLRFGMFQVRFFEVCSTSILYMANTCKYFSTADAYDPQKLWNRS